MLFKQAFGKALRQMRKARRLSQEDFGGCSSQTYLSQMERGGKGPTLEMVAALAAVMNVHPLTLLMKCFLYMDEAATLDATIERIRNEIDETS